MARCQWRQQGLPLLLTTWALQMPETQEQQVLHLQTQTQQALLMATQACQQLQRQLLRAMRGLRQARQRLLLAMASWHTSPAGQGEVAAAGAVGRDREHCREGGSGA